MGERGQTIMIALTAFFFLGMFATFPAGCFSDSNQHPQSKKKSVHPASPNRFGSSVIFPVQGNVYPLGYGFWFFTWILRMLLIIMLHRWFSSLAQFWDLFIFYFYFLFFYFLYACVRLSFRGFNLLTWLNVRIFVIFWIIEYLTPLSQFCLICWTSLIFKLSYKFSLKVILNWFPVWFSL